jgi:hypothetical protein
VRQQGDGWASLRKSRLPENWPGAVTAKANYDPIYEKSEIRVDQDLNPVIVRGRIIGWKLKSK